MTVEDFQTYAFLVAETTPATPDATRWRRTTGPAEAGNDTPAAARPRWAMPGRAPMIWTRVSNWAMAGLMALMMAVVLWMVFADIPSLHKAIGVGAGGGLLASSVIALRSFGSRHDASDEKTESLALANGLRLDKLEARLDTMGACLELILASLGDRADENAEIVPAVTSILDRLTRTPASPTHADEGPHAAALEQRLARVEESLGVRYVQGFTDGASGLPPMAP